MGECMPKEQQEFIDELQHYMLGASNLTSEEAGRFAFRVWQHRRHLKWFFEQNEPVREWKDEKMTLGELLQVVNDNTYITILKGANNIFGSECLFTSTAGSSVMEYYTGCEVSHIGSGNDGNLCIVLAK